MGAFSDLRAALASDLADGMGVPVFPAWPDTVQPPCAFLVPPIASSYIIGGPQLQTYTLAVDVVILVPHGPADTGIGDLETLVESALKYSEDWSLSGVDAPSPVTVTEGGAEYLGTVLHLSKPTVL